VEGRPVRGSYGTGLLHRIQLPATPGAAVDDVVARFDHGITDVEAGPDGALYVSTSNAIWRIEGDAASMSPIAVPSTSAAPAAPAGPTTAARSRSACSRGRGHRGGGRPRDAVRGRPAPAAPARLGRGRAARLRLTLAALAAGDRVSRQTLPAPECPAR
jgi:hypothetical protein